MTDKLFYVECPNPDDCPPVFGTLEEIRDWILAQDELGWPARRPPEAAS